MDFYFEFQAKGARFPGQSDQKSAFSPQPPCSYHKKVELAVPKMGQKVVFCFVSCYKNIKITKSVQVHPPSAHEGVNIPSNALCYLLFQGTRLRKAYVPVTFWKEVTTKERQKRHCLGLDASRLSYRR